MFLVLHINNNEEQSQKHTFNVSLVVIGQRPVGDDDRCKEGPLRGLGGPQKEHGLEGVERASEGPRERDGGPQSEIDHK